MRNAVADALQEAGLTVSQAELERRIATAIRELVHRQTTANSGADFTREEQMALVEGGFDLSPRRPNDENAALRAAEQYAALLATSLTVREAAQRLHLDGSRIRQRLLARQLYGVRQSSGWLLPSFQFNGNEILPGLQRVLPHLDPQLHPLAVVRWFTRLNPDLANPAGVDEKPLSPRDWLLSGGNPDVVAELAEDAAGYR